MKGGSGRILVVEDDVDTGTMLCELLRTQGYRVQWVTRGREALTRLRSNVALDIDVVLLDLMLPDVDGSVVADHVARLERKPAVIILSSRRPGALATQPGVLGSFRKPFDVRRLLDMMAEVVQGTTHLSTLANAIAALRASPPPLGSSFDGRAWQPARRVVDLTLTHFDEPSLAATSYDLALALRAYRAAETAQRALLTTFVPEGGGDIDCAVGDAYCFSLLQLALAIARNARLLGIGGDA
jgi:DNA-binding response OmpR family regulator